MWRRRWIVFSTTNVDESGHHIPPTHVCLVCRPKSAQPLHIDCIACFQGSDGSIACGCKMRRNEMLFTAGELSWSLQANRVTSPLLRLIRQVELLKEPLSLFYSFRHTNFHIYFVHSTLREQPPRGRCIFTMSTQTEPDMTRTKGDTETSTSPTHRGEGTEPTQGWEADGQRRRCSCQFQRAVMSESHAD
uniref:Uncharacterized protein n=1 Tax=Echinococcus granulosus TaxID=6210 RepID=A0A068WXE4_ECHGR|nr:hypothetical protein EgrG_002030000 [Echinococcus granulosus]